MLGHQPYFHGLTRKYVSYFGTIFNDIYIERTDGLLKVPLSYAPKKKILIRFEQDPEINRQSAVTLPRMSFEIAGNYIYDGTRNLTGLHKHIVKNDTNANNMKYTFTAAPVNIPFNLYIYVKNTEDANRIVEQIIPFFKPEWNASLQLIPEMGITRDVPLILTSNGFEDTYDGSFKDRQVLTYTMSFLMKAWYFGPIYDKPIIKFANTNFYIPSGSIEDGVSNTDVISSTRITPGLDADGNPTSNAELTIAAGEIYVDDDFGYVIETTGITSSANTGTSE